MIQYNIRLRRRSHAAVWAIRAWFLPPTLPPSLSLSLSLSLTHTHTHTTLSCGSSLRQCALRSEESRLFWSSFWAGGSAAGVGSGQGANA
jgi:hypothetical protein